jgi:hypothetical protein
MRINQKDTSIVPQIAFALLLLDNDNVLFSLVGKPRKVQ